MALSLLDCAQIMRVKHRLALLAWQGRHPFCTEQHHFPALTNVPECRAVLATAS